MVFLERLKRYTDLCIGKLRYQDLEDIILTTLISDDREQFILDNQEAFNYGALEEFCFRDDHFEEDGEIISRAIIEKSIDSGEAYRIMLGITERPASTLLGKMYALGLTEKITGVGKGKYRFIQ